MYGHKDRYRVSSWAVLFVALALVLAACGKGGPEDTETSAAQGVLEVALAGVERADVIVASGAETVWQGAITGAKEWTLAPGTYLVDGLPVAGMLDPTLARVDVTANGRTSLTLNYEAGPNQTPPGGGRPRGRARRGDGARHGRGGAALQA